MKVKKAFGILGLAGFLALNACGQEEKTIEDKVVIEGTVYLSPTSTLESALTSELSAGRIKLAQREKKILDEGTARLDCIAKQTFEKGCPSKEYIESAVSRGKYKIETTSQALTEGGAAICAEDKNGENTQCAIPNPIKPYKTGDFVPPQITQDLSQETTAHFQLTIGYLQEAKQEFGKITKTLFGNLWGGAGDLYKDVIEFFKQHQSTLDVKSYFDRLFEEEKELKDIGEIYKKNTGSKRDSQEVGNSIGERARKVDPGGGNYIEITEDQATEGKCNIRGFLSSDCWKACRTNLDECFNGCSDIEDECVDSCQASFGRCYENCNHRTDCINLCRSEEDKCFKEVCNPKINECWKACRQESYTCETPCCETAGCYWKVGVGEYCSEQP